MPQVKVDLYNAEHWTNIEDDEFIGRLYLDVDTDEEAYHIMKRYDDFINGFMDPVVEEFVDRVSDIAFKKFADYFEKSPCDVRLQISKRM